MHTITKARLLATTSLLIAATTAHTQPARAQTGGPVVNTQGTVAWVEGNQPVQPAKGTPGNGNSYNWGPFFVPGQLVTNADPGEVIGQPYNVAYANNKQPVQSSDWWSGVGLQWQGWVQQPIPESNPVVTTYGFTSEPFDFSFIDLPASKTVAGLDSPVQGLRMWNANDMRVFTASDNTATNLFGRGGIADLRSPIVTVGLQGMHPIAEATPIMPTSAPWTNVKIQSYSDWGVVMSYSSGGSELTFTMANGSPFTWAERTKGNATNAPFRVWAGMDDSDPNGALTVWHNQDGALGLTVATTFVAPGDGNPAVVSTAAYAVYADQGAWTEQESTNPAAHMSLFSNDQATKVVVAALPHNIDVNDTAALTVVLTDLGQYAWNKISNTQVHYPPITGSQTSVTVTGGLSMSLGYDPANSVIRSMLAVSTTNLLTGEQGQPALQVVFPHHRKAMIAQDQANILKGGDNQPKYVWRSVKGELHAYVGNSYVRELRAYGVLPFLPSVAIHATAPVNGQVPADDIYAALKTWFYEREPETVGQNDAFSINTGPYFPYGGNTYQQGMATLFENLSIADQLAQAPGMTAIDPDFNRPKQDVADDMHDFILDTLKEIVGRWGDVYTAGFFQYNPTYDTMYGFPQGYGSVQNLADKHFHWGYFLRSSAAIGRHDIGWLRANLPLLNQLRGDVAAYNRSQKRYPILRNFSPFYGHNWADGLGNGGNGNNQESTSEAINFAVGLIELGQLLGNTEWRDIGLYLYEEEILATEQYWFNIDADLSQSSGTYYNGNWPDAFVRYVHTPTNQSLITPVIGQVWQTFATRGTFFGADGYPAATNPLLIQFIPLSASHLYLNRHPQWLTDVWAEVQRESQIDPGKTAYETILAGLQARVPGDGGTGVNDPGPLGAITRVNEPHHAFFGAVNSQAKHWAYSLNALGQLDMSVTADVPNYAVFCNGATGPNCAGGERAFVAYNPDATDDLKATFKDANGATVATMVVQHGDMATQVGLTTIVDEPLTKVRARNRLYLLKPSDYSADCGPLTSPAQTLPMSTTAGTWTIGQGQVPFPSDTSAIAPSIVCVPARPDEGGTDTPPDAAYTRVWRTQFSGARNPDQVNSQGKAFTSFAFYTNQSLFPGWQQDPCTAGGPTPPLPASCPNAGLNPPGAGNVYSFQFAYDFNSDGTPDRIEMYQNVALVMGNTFGDKSKTTNYRFDQDWPFNTTGNPPMNLRGDAAADFPTNIPANAPATLTVTMFGGSTPDLRTHFPVPVSVNADPDTGRASWIQPPYAVRVPAQLAPAVDTTADGEGQ